MTLLGDRYLQQFDVVYSLSDLHLGGESGFQIFDKRDRLAQFIDDIGVNNPVENVALVLNGDVIDTLAEENYGYVARDEAEAIGYVERIFDDEAFAEVWRALTRYLTHQNHHLVFVAGNHDIELGLPVVERYLRHRLEADQPGVSHRLLFSGRGAGYACGVAGARVLFSHGNELDRFNTVDNEKLGQLALAHNAGRRIGPDEWVPNFGTRLVVDVMNHLKRRYPFIDLLKPQEAAIFGIVLLLGRDLLDHVDWRDLMTHAQSLRRSHQTAGELLGPHGRVVGAEPDQVTLTDLLGPRLRARSSVADSSITEDDLLDLVDDQVEANPEFVSGRQESDQVLGLFTKARGLFGGEDQKQDALRDAIEDWREGSPRFGADFVNQADDEMSERLRTVGSRAHFTVAGHTHRARAISFASTNYFNSGTWIRILEIPEAALKTRESFAQVWDALTAGTLAAIDQVKLDLDEGEPASLLLDFATAVEIRHDAGRRETVGHLIQVEADGSWSYLDKSRLSVRC